MRPIMAAVNLMKKSRSEFVAHLSEVFVDFGPVSARRMFGGYGVYYDGLMFGLVADDVLYLKADTESEQHFSSGELELLGLFEGFLQHQSMQLVQG